MVRYRKMSSPGLRLVDEITDDLLIEIRKDVISAGNAAQPKPLSGLAQQKVMLWVVIDAVRSPVVLSGADLSRAAGRIWKQAARVSEALSVTAKEHAYRRDAARAAAAADQGLAAGLPMQLAAISAAEEERCDKLRREVYEGLTELAAAPDDAPAPALIEAPKPHNTAIFHHTLLHRRGACAIHTLSRTFVQLSGRCLQSRLTWLPN